MWNLELSMQQFGKDERGPEPQPEERRVPPPPPPHSVQLETPDTPQPEAPRPGWSLWEALPVILFMLFLAAASMGGPEPKASAVNVRAILIIQSFLYAALLLYIHYIVRIKHRLPFFVGLGWRRVSAPFFLVSGLALAFAVQLLSLPQTRQLPIERLFQTPEAALLLAIFGTAIAPLVEEVIFRGFIFGALERSSGTSAAIWLTALLFAAIHVPQLRGGTAQILAIFGVGLMLSWTRARTRSLAASYFMHLGYNGTLFVMLYVATQGFRKMNGM